MKNNKLLIGLVVVLVVFPLFFLPSVFKSSEEEQTYNDSSREEVVPTTEDETSGELVEDPNGEELGDEGEVIEGDTEHPATGSEAGGVASNGTGSTSNGAGTTTGSGVGSGTVTIDEEADLEFELIQKDGVNFAFEHVTKNVGDEAVKLSFPTEKELSWNLAIIELYEDFNNQGGGKAKDEVKKGRTITLQPNETLVHNISISSELIPKGKYELTVQLAAENIAAPTLAIEFENK